MNMQGLKEVFEGLGVKAGASLMVSSDILQIWSLFREAENQFHPDMMIGLLQELITEEGTLVFPTYHWGFCQGKPFDYRKTRSKTGALGQTALSMEGFSRTKHPIYSFAVWGKDKEALVSMENTAAFGEDSPFRWFLEKEYKNLVLDVSIKHSYTFIHYVESQLKVPFRYEKEFTAPYVDGDGVEELRTYSMFVRDLDLEVEIPDHVDGFFSEQVEDGSQILEGVLFQMVDFKKAYDLIEQDLLENNGRNVVSYLGQPTT